MIYAPTFVGVAKFYGFEIEVSDIDLDDERVTLLCQAQVWTGPRRHSTNDRCVCAILLEQTAI